MGTGGYPPLEIGRSQRSINKAKWGAKKYIRRLWPYSAISVEIMRPPIAASVTVYFSWKIIRIFSLKYRVG